MPFPLPPITLRCAWLAQPLGIDVPMPRLSWQHAVADDAWLTQQGSFHVQVASSATLLDGDVADIWDSGIVLTAAQWTLYAGPPLNSRERYYWRVRVSDPQGAASEWSAVSWWEMGLLTDDDWHGQWIFTARLNTTDAPLDPCQYLRRDFPTHGQLTQARLYITARGLYEATLNGQRVGTQYLTPGWTDYDRRIQYQTYDVTDFLTSGMNTLGVILGSGWYSGYLSNIGPHHYGAVPQLLAQLALIYADGTTELVTSDHLWKAADGPLRTADLLQGETFDARHHMPGWNLPGFPDDQWAPVAIAARRSTPQLVADCAQPIQVTEVLAPRQITRLDATTQLIDFGQNLVGWVRLTIPAQASASIRLGHVEMLDATGQPYYANLRSARQTDIYIPQAHLSQDEGATEPTHYEPRFTVHGFRYVALHDYPGDLSVGDIRACVVGSATPRIGTFATGHPLVNQLYHNILWGQRGNFLSVPTDCPQRDERMGWLGDAQVFVGTAAYNMDVVAFFTKWMQDIRDGQSANGAFPDIAPRVVVLNDGAPGWGDAGVIIPWTMYRMFGERQMVEQSWEAMTRWIQYLADANPSGLRQARNGNNYGDWLAVDDLTENHVIATRTPKDLLATAYYARIVHMMAELADMLHCPDEAHRYHALHAHIKAAFQAAYIDQDGQVAGHTQTAYVLALAFDLVPPDRRAASAHHLVADLADRAWHLATGFLGVGHLLPVLTACGYNDIAYRLLLQETYPSWGYSIAQGATTIWERWDGWTEERGFQDPAMNSFNHYSLGSVGEWLYRSVAGIEPLPSEVGMGRFRLHPHPIAALGWVDASWESPYGTVGSSWRIDADHILYAYEVPPNAQATVILPTTAPETAREAIARQSQVEYQAIHLHTNGVEFRLPAGRFTCRVPFSTSANQPYIKPLPHDIAMPSTFNEE